MMRIGSGLIAVRAVMVVLLLCGFARGALAQGPETAPYTVLFRSLGFSYDILALSVDGPRTLEELQDLVCQIAGDYQINISASRWLDVQMYRDISEEEYLPESYLPFLDEDAGVVFQNQEERTLAVYRWTPMTEGTSPYGFVQSRLARLAREGIELANSIELLMGGDGGPIRPAELHEFDHTEQCSQPER